MLSISLQSTQLELTARNSSSSVTTTPQPVHGSPWRSSTQPRYGDRSHFTSCSGGTWPRSWLSPKRRMQQRIWIIKKRKDYDYFGEQILRVERRRRLCDLRLLHAKVLLVGAVVLLEVVRRVAIVQAPDAVHQLIAVLDRCEVKRCK